MSQPPLMPKATAVWLVENTSLTFEQIAEFCKLHPLEVQRHRRWRGRRRHQGPRPDHLRPAHPRGARARRQEPEPPPQARRAQGQGAARSSAPRGRATRPVSKRQDRPNAILWLLRNHPELKDAQIIRLIGTTKSTIAADPRPHPLERPDPDADRSGQPRPVLADRPRLRGRPRRQGSPGRGRRGRLDPAAGRGDDRAGAAAPLSQTFADMSKPKREEEAAIDVDSVFAKLKQIKRPADEDDEG